ncbi:MAG TPA: ATP-dependent helicase, partial [Anaerolineae bacterium]|nr:ATP-dependent helicase [Anaerolineae bacterium]
MEKVLLEGLNDEQQDAVTSTEGPLLIIAGAGTGKTRVITRRIAYLLESKPDIAPENILALTYTNKAADEMRERVEALTNLDTGDMFIGTIHAFCNQVLDEVGTHIGLPKLRQIDGIDQWIFLEDHLDKLGLDYYLTLANPRDVLKDFVRFVSRCKDEMVLPQDYAEYASGLRADFKLTRGELGDEERRVHELEVIREEELARVYRIYQDELLKAGLRDFGDSIIYTIKLFKERPNILRSYQGQFKYILIDEFQDTNLAQIEIFTFLAARRRNICACGDSDQAIYRFRGASFASFNHFIDKFPEAKRIRLNKNYRSGGHILSAACRLIENNGADRFEPAVLVPNNGEGEHV